MKPRSGLGASPPPWGPRRATCGRTVGPRHPWMQGAGSAAGAGAHHAVGVAAVVVHAVLHQLLLVQVAGTAVRAGEGGPVGDGAAGVGSVSGGQAGLAHLPAACPDPITGLPCPPLCGLRATGRKEAQPKCQGLRLPWALCFPPAHPTATALELCSPPSPLPVPPLPHAPVQAGEDCPSTACPERRRLSSPRISGGQTSCWEVAPGPSSGSPSYRVARTSTEGMQQPLLPPQGGAALPPPSNAGQALSPQGTGTLSTPSRVAYLGMGWDVGTTGTNLGQLAICSWTFMQEEMCTLILASVTWEERGGGWGSVEAKASGCRGRGNDQQAGQVPGGLSQGLRVPAREETLREGDTGQDPEGPPSSAQQQVLTASRCGSAGGRRPATSPGQEHALVGPSGSCRRAGTVHGGPGRAFIPS